MIQNYKVKIIGIFFFLVMLSVAKLVRAQGSETPKAEQQNEIPTRFFENFIGTWQAPDTVLAKFPPEIADKPLVTYEWGSEKRIVRLFEVHAAGKKEDGIMEGFALWNPVTHKVEFYAYNKQSDFLFKGEYTILEDNRIQRIYEVYYPRDHQFYKGGNAVITFRETSTLSENKKIKYNEVVYYNKRDGRWAPWSTSAMTRIH